MTPWFHPAAEQEVAAALKVGEERGFGLGRELVQEIRRVSALLCDVPNMGEQLDARTDAFHCAGSPLASSIAWMMTCSES
jgi:hypothetical protein